MPDCQTVLNYPLEKPNDRPQCLRDLLNIGTSYVQAIGAILAGTASIEGSPASLLRGGGRLAARARDGSERDHGAEKHPPVPNLFFLAGSTSS